MWGLDGPAQVGHLLGALGWRQWRPLEGRSAGVEALSAGVPAAVVLLDAPSAEDAVGVAYSREARYVIDARGDSLRLFVTDAWVLRPGDSPAFTLDNQEDAEDVQAFLGLLGRDSVLDDLPAQGLDGVPRHPALADVLADALRYLRLSVAEADAWRQPFGTGPGPSPAIGDRDSAVLRLFSQLLYTRVVEDRTPLAAGPRLADAIAGASPQDVVAEVLNRSRRQLDSELFVACGVEVSELPGEALRRVIRAMVEPWEALRLDFSVLRDDLAGRLYERYLADLPAEELDRGRPRLFAAARTVDRRRQGASFYTPVGLAEQLTTRALAAGPDDGLIVDPACGSGAFLTAALAELLARGEGGRRAAATGRPRGAAAPRRRRGHRRTRHRAGPRRATRTGPAARTSAVAGRPAARRRRLRRPSRPSGPARRLGQADLPPG